MKVYKTVQVDGYLTNFGYGEAALQEGFGYLEKLNYPTKLTLYVKQGGRMVEQVINPQKENYEPKSRFEYVYEFGGPSNAGKNIFVSRSVSRDRTSGELLGEAVTYSAYPGWLERNTVQLLGRGLWTCPEDAGIHADLVKRTIRPVKS